ncbi:DUF5337 domain-containing protein [Pseudogemmobacter sonorensis]|uniref:DUF5337 domain-containing protein n=1 Tax=Pseudogemmobacter sonorensis TaxID=2989681 RepID=UPI0036A9DCDE
MREGDRNGGAGDGTGAKARLVALVIAGTMVLWMVAQWLGGRIGLDVRYVFLFDLAALAAFIWALAVTWQIWRARRG